MKLSLYNASPELDRLELLFLFILYVFILSNCEVSFFVLNSMRCKFVSKNNPDVTVSSKYSPTS